MAVNGTEYRMWAEPAKRDDLPEAAFVAVVEGVLPKDEPLSSWQQKVFKKAIPALLARLQDQELRTG